MADAFFARRKRTAYRRDRSWARVYFGLRGQGFGTLIRHRSCSAPARTMLAHAVAMVQATLPGALMASADGAQIASPCIVVARPRAVQLPPIMATAKVEELAASLAALLAKALVQGARAQSATRPLR